MADRPSDLDQLIERAAQARADAQAASLDNVRERCLRAEAAWLAMADRARRTARMRDDQAELKARQNSQVQNSQATGESLI